MSEKQKTLDKIRRFNRYYTKLIGLLDNHLLDSKYSLVEARVLYEIHVGVKISAAQIVLELNIDKGQLSKVLKRLENNELIIKQPSEVDGRVTLVSLTTKGKKIYNELDNASNLQIEAMISTIKKNEQQQLTKHMLAIQKILTTNL
jgi:DNA-binding MarR family transcriptional regulator